ncbi:MAG: nuclear transport factor 2 family protein, partial [Acidobacteria bacterium]|nr:nuclear transport factor 2 family protein [Acidobacteriota bacterium]
GTIGFSSGPVFDENGEKFSTYTSIWTKQSDGSWKVLFDGPGCQVCPVCKK